MNTQQTIEVPIAQQHLNRITVEGDRILNVFGVNGQYLLEADEDQGQVFIRPTRSNPLHLTLITEKGHTQDLRLIPKNQAPEALLLKSGEKDIKRDKKINSPLIRQEIEDLLHACEQNRIPLGYREIPLEVETLPYHIIREIRSSTLRGLTFKLSNFVTEAEFAKTCGIPHLIAVLISGGRIHVVARTL